MSFERDKFTWGIVRSVLSRYIGYGGLLLIGGVGGAVTTYNNVINNYSQKVEIQELNVNIYDSSNADAIVDGLLKYDPEKVNVLVQSSNREDNLSGENKRTDNEGLVKKIIE